MRLVPAAFRLVPTGFDGLRLVSTGFDLFRLVSDWFRQVPTGFDSDWFLLVSTGSDCFPTGPDRF